MKPTLLVCAGALLVGAGCRTEGAAPPESARPSLFQVAPAQLARLQIVVVSKRAVQVPIEVPALVKFNELKTSHVVALVSGKVAKVMAHEGDQVKAGQALLTIASPDASDVAANLSRDRSALNIKQVIYTRDQDLYAHKAISLEELQQAELDVSAAKATLKDDEAHAQITGGASSFAVLRAPIAGVVVERKIAVGEAVQAGSTPCMTITDPNQAWVIGQLYQQDLKRAQLGDVAVIRSPVLSQPVEGKVTYIGASIDSDTLTIPVRIAVGNPGGLLKEGMYVSAEIIPAATAELIMVPSSTVLRDDDNLPFVYVEVSPGSFARRHVVLGPQVHDEYAITDGLKTGEKVIGSGALFVQFADSLGR